MKTQMLPIFPFCRGSIEDVNTETYISLWKIIFSHHTPTVDATKLSFLNTVTSLYHNITGNLQI